MTHQGYSLIKTKIPNMLNVSFIVSTQKHHCFYNNTNFAQIFKQLFWNGSALPFHMQYDTTLWYLCDETVKKKKKKKKIGFVV